MDYEIQEKLDAVLVAIEQRQKLPSNAPVATKRQLDEKVCLTSRALYWQYKESVLWCRAVANATHTRVHQALDSAVKCLPEHDYPPNSNAVYDVRESVTARFQDFKELASLLLEDLGRPGWYKVPIPLQPA